MAATLRIKGESALKRQVVAEALAPCLDNDVSGSDEPDSLKTCEIDSR